MRMQKNIHKFDIDTGNLETLKKEVKYKGNAENIVEEYYKDQGWNVLNISPTMSSRSLPNKLQFLEDMLKPGAPDLFLYGKENKRNRFVEVKDKGDGFRFEQLKYMKDNSIECSVVFVDRIDDEFECSDCGKIFDSEKGLKIHKSHCYNGDGEKPVKIRQVSRF